MTREGWPVARALLSLAVYSRGAGSGTSSAGSRSAGGSNSSDGSDVALLLGYLQISATSDAAACGTTRVR